MRTRTDYEQAFALVRAAIARWDPYDLLRLGAPENEFDSEVALLIPRLKEIRSGSEAALAVRNVFAGRFERAQFDPDSCEKVGADIYRALSEGGLLGKHAQWK